MTRILIFATALLLYNCGGNTQKKAALTTEQDIVIVDMHHAENSLDYAGIYKGTLPAADGPGIDTILTLDADGKYHFEQSYIDRDVSFVTTGNYAVVGNLLTLESDDTTSYYKIEENRLRMLDADKQEIIGELAEYYILNKTN